MVTSTDQKTWNIARDDLRAALVSAQQERDQRPGLLRADDGGQECEWVVYERFILWVAVNRWRHLAGLDPVDVAMIRRAESSAEGHVDYTDQLATNCAQIALGMGDWDSRAPLPGAG